MTFDDVIEQTQAWEHMTAYDRTKIYCDFLVRSGQPLPSWNVIREHIGRGSANDINRAKNDFRVEHGERLREMDSFAAKGVPESISPLVVSLWQAALKEATGNFEKERIKLTHESEQLRHQSDASDKERSEALIKVEQLLMRISSLEETKEALESQVKTEQAAREQAEKMASSLREDMVQQREALDTALNKAQEDLDLAITRLESTERRSMMEIERARQDAIKKVEHIEGERVLQAARLQNKMASLKEQNSELSQAKQELEVKLALASTNLAQSQKQLEQAQEQNAKLMKALGRNLKARGKHGASVKQGLRKTSLRRQK